MKRSRSFFSHFRKSIQFRLTFFFLLSIVPLTLVSLYAVAQCKQIVLKQAGERTRAAMLSSLGNIDQIMANLNQFSLSIANNTYMNDLLNKDESETNMIISASQLWDYLRQYTIGSDYLSDVWILHSNLNMIISRETGGSRIDYEAKDWYKQAILGGGTSLMYNPDGIASGDESDPLDNRDAILLLREMGFNYGRQHSHVVGITVERDTLLQLCQGLITTPETKFFLIAPDNKVIVSNTGSRTLPFQIPHNNESYIQHYESSGRQDLFVTSVISPKSGWSMLLAQPERIINQESIKLQRFIYVLILLSVLLALFISVIVYTGISAPVSTLLKGIYQLRNGRLDVHLKHNRVDEFGVLTESFNQMAAQQKQYIQDIYEQQVEKTRTELKFLQSQINPHFLYNTLDSIYSSAINYDAEEISEMVLNLSKFFRLSLTKGKDTSTLDETIEHLGYYIRIQQLRFADHFTWECRIDEPCGTLPILKLLLQPIVENAIHHGLEKTPAGGALMLEAAIRQDMLCVAVRDTGAGIPSDRLLQLQAELARIRSSVFMLQADGQSGEFFGLKNVCSRLKLYYGDQAELRVDSKEGQGTEVIVRIPLGALNMQDNIPLKEEEADEAARRRG
ncbi:sensor histidine kinase [Paenibacillus lycopersici]|uniref:histidine kinase n=1 Tax=Paenibacillus lycopersici TaxID=2704462 RepID=A0A6C0G200_9BACL|nr:sensor histidine kinase [Paenibacillus lycopersici]QHT61364.1 sensor histidine kinase [Paenibacillus lycopersici]